MPDHRTLPLVTFYLTERCNSRCITCDYWRHGRKDATLESVTRVLPDLRRLGTRVALLSGGEPLLNPEWRSIAATLSGAGISVWLLTSGLALAKHATAASGLCDSITVSLDGTNPATYQAIRGLDAFDKVCEGVRAAVSLDTPVESSRHPAAGQLPRIAGIRRRGPRAGRASRSRSSQSTSQTRSAFARETVDSNGLALQADDLPELARLIDKLEREQADAFESRFIAESPDKLRRIHQYFAALLGLGPFPPVRCNAPEFSAVIGVDTRVAPCFFIPGTGIDTHAGLSAAPRRSSLNVLACIHTRGCAPGVRSLCAPCGANRVHSTPTGRGSTR